MQTELEQIATDSSPIEIYGVEEMLETAGNTPLHTFTAKEIEDYGELCDQDCQDCD